MRPRRRGIHGHGADRRGLASAQAGRRRARRARGPLARRNSPTTVGPEPLTSAASAPASQRLRERLARSADTARSAAALQVVVQQLARRRAAPRPQLERARQLAASRRSSAPRRASQPEAGRPRAYTAAVDSSAAERQHEHADGGSAAGSSLQALARARGQPAPGRDLRGHVGAQPRRELRQQLLVAEARRVPRQAQRRRRIRRAAPQPGGDRDALDDAQPQRRRVPAGARAEQRAARAPPGSRSGAPATPGQTTSSSPVARGRPSSSVSSSASEIDCITLASSCLPSPSRTGPTNSPRLIFAGATRARASACARRRGGGWVCASSSSAQPPARESPRARGARRARRAGWPSSTSAARTCSRERPRARRAAQRAGQRLAPMGERAGHERAQRGRDGAGSPPAHGASHEHRVDVRHGMKDGARDRPQHPHLARELGDHRSCAVLAAAGRRRQALADLALDHRHPAAHAPAAPRSCAAAPPRRSRRAGSRRPSSGCGRSAREVDTSSHRPSARSRWREGRSRRSSASRRRSSISTTCTCATRSARCSDSTPRPPPISSTTSCARQLGGALDHAEDVRVDQEVLPELAVGMHVEPAHAPQPRLDGSRARHGAHPQPNTRAALRSTRRVRARPTDTPRSSAMKAAVWATNAGWLRCLRTACGVR